ncbi:P2Y purinoceptor 13 isoform X2 [Sphaerodactylus townsendi]|nr:P2Y purinoceptor 13 isoform X2 [Sphaerodactylus townsendi]
MNASINISNETTPSFGQCHRDTTASQVAFPILYTILFLAGLLLNGLAMQAFSQIPTTSSFIVYLWNILFSDFIMTLMLPFKILAQSELGPWQLKAFVCRFSAVAFYSTMYVSIAFLGIISLDRFLKIVRPFGKVWLRTITSAKILSGSVWLFFFSLSLPNMILSNQKATPHSVKKCALLKSHLGLKWHKAVNYICQVVFWIVLIFTVLFYVVIAKKICRSYRKTQTAECKIKQRAKCKVFIIVAVFFICFAPFHFTRVPYTLSQTGKTHDCSTENQLYIAKESTLWLAATNICMDPLIYILLCRQFVEKAFCIKMRKSTRTSQENTSMALVSRVST